MMLAIQLDERTKRILLVLCALVIIILLISGAIYFIISKYMERESKKIDEYLYDLCVYKVIKDGKEFRKAMLYYERIHLFNKAKWPIRIIVIITVALFVLGHISFGDNFKDLFFKGLDLIPIFHYQTVGEVNEVLIANNLSPINMPGFLPTSVFPNVISKNPDFSDVRIYISTFYLVLLLFFGVLLIRAVLSYIARITRGFKMSTEVFGKNLEKLNMFERNNNEVNKEN